MIKTKSKRVIIDPTNNPALEAIFSYFENYYCGMTRAEILKMAFINFYQTNSLPVVQMTDEDEEEFARAMDDQTPYVTLSGREQISNFVNSL